MEKRVTRRRGLSLVGHPARLGRDELLDDVPEPYFATWYCTRKCNLSCAHCFVDVTSAPAHRDPVDTKTAMNMIDNLVRNDVYQLGFAGGEPMLRPDFFELAAYARRLDMTIQVATNGLFVDDSAVGRLLDSGFKCIQISLDGASRGTHDVLRGRGRFDAALRGVRAATAGGLPVVLAIAVHRGNLHEAEAIVDLALRESAIILKVQPVFTPFEWRGQPGALSGDAVRGVLHRIRERAVGTDLEISIPRWAQIVESGGREDTCVSQFRAVSILDDGRLSLCDFAPENAFGDIIHRDFYDEWRQVVTQHHRRGRCGCSNFIEDSRQEEQEAVA